MAQEGCISTGASLFLFPNGSLKIGPQYKFEPKALSLQKISTIKNKDMDKSIYKDIETRFDNEVTAYSNLETGQSTIIDAPLALEVVTEAAKRIVPHARRIVDIGCGAGNYTMKMLQKIPNLECTLVDLSRPMLEKARERVSSATNAEITVMHEDFRTAPLAKESFDIALAGAVLHHLRDDKDWESAFAKLYSILKKGGCLMISDLIVEDVKVLDDYSRERFADHLERIGGKEFRINHLLAVAREDTPRTMTYQLELMKKVGFSQVNILHKNACFGSFCGIK